MRFEPLTTETRGAGYFWQTDPTDVKVLALVGYKPKEKWHEIDCIVVVRSLHCSLRRTTFLEYISG